MPRLMTLKEIQAEKLPVANSRYYEWLASGEMPKPVKVGNRNLWPEHEVDQWIDELIARRDRGEMALPMSRPEKRLSKKTGPNAEPPKRGRGRPRKASR